MIYYYTSFNAKQLNILINPETKQIKLIDFSIASLLPRETQALINPNVLEGTLAYISPEQTGRMNRGIDYRTDFYSLGVTFYQLLTGKLPFESKEPMELVHCHIAKYPPDLREKKGKEIPQVFCDIVIKLIAKNAEDRYQSALGLKADLENCLHQLQETGKIEGFEIGRRDLCDRFLIPDKLYGRETDAATLLQAFERVSLGATEMMLVAGFSGIGKTAVVNEVHKPIVRQRGYFIKGKYDQFNRNIPLSAFVQTLQDLMGQLLSESDTQVAQWKDKILSALGENGQVLIQVIPELEQIIGKQPAAPELSGSAAQNRFNLLFQKFIAVFAKAEHPLVMFLDDLQWADSASLSLMQVLLSQSEVGYLLTIGAYRDNEVFPAHPLMLTLEEMKKDSATISTLTLTPLSQSHINRLVADTLSCSTVLAQPLSELIYQKTKGNPFFATQFLKTLHQEGYIAYDLQVGHWQCDMVAVRSLSLTDNVVEFMALQLQKLPEATQEILKLAACVGAQFDLETLAIVSEKSPTDAATALWKALQEGLILPTSQIYKFFQDTQQPGAEDTVNPTYRFLHDRVQQAAYSLIPADQKQATHLQMGQLLQQKLSEIDREDKIFDIVGHLNLGIELIAQPQERQTLAQLNLKAGTKARSATAYAAARVYLQSGLELLSPDCWETQYELTLNLYAAAAEASYLNSDFEGMEQLAAFVLQQAQTILDKVKIYEIKIAAHTARNQALQAIAVGAEALKQLGVDFPTEADEALIGSALQQLNQQLQGREIAELVDLPAMSDPNAQAAIQLLGRLFSAVYQGMPGLLPLLGATMVRLSLEFGNAPASTIGYVAHSMVLCAFFGEVETGYKFGQLALSVLERLNTQSMKCITLGMFGFFIQPHQEALRAALVTLKESYKAGMETGNLLSAGYDIGSYSHLAFFAGVELDLLEPELAAYSAAMAQMNNDSARFLLDMTWQTVQNLRETVSQPDRLIGNAYDETVMLPKHQQDNELMMIVVVYIFKLLLAYSCGNYPAAVDILTQLKPCWMVLSGTVFIPIFHFYAALTHLALVPTGSEPEQTELLTVVATHQAALHQSAHNAPMNHLHKWHLVEAERYRVFGNKAAAIEHYDQAIALAQKHQFTNDAALANELSAKFYLEWNKERIAQEYMTQAYYGYARWGAKAKVANLERCYPQLLALILEQAHSALSVNETVFAVGTVTSTSSSSSGSDSLDLCAILKASHAISGEIELGKLLSSLLSIVIENAGADKCVFMLLRDDRLLIKGSITLGSEPVVLQRLRVEESQDIPLKLIYKVLHFRQTTVLVNATVDPTLANDPYIVRQQPKSILCSPILHQGKLMGILYLENNLATGAFTSDRVELLNLLCAQAAISLENARLYEQAQQMLAELRASKARFQKLADNVPGMIYQISLAPDGSVSIPYVSPGCAELYEVPPEEFLTGIRDFRMLEYPDDRPALTEAFVHSAQTLAPFEQQWRIITTSGTVKWVQAASRPERQADGSIVWDGVMIDISDRKLSEKSHRLTQFAIDRSSVPIWWVKPSGQISYVNDAACRDLGYSRIEILQKHVGDFNPELSSEVWKKHWQELKEKGSFIFEAYNFNKSGHRYPVEVTVNYLELDGEEYNCAFVKNISDRKQTEATLQEKEQFLRSIYEGAEIFIVVTDVMADGSFRYAGFNPAAEKIGGVCEIDVVGKTPVEVYGEQVGEAIQKNFAECAASGMPISTEDLLTFNGEEKWFLATHNPIENEKGQIYRIITTAIDIGDRKLAELALEQKSLLLEQALHNLQNAQLQIVQSEKMSALGNLVAGVGHEMNNPLGFIAASLKQVKPTIFDIIEHLKLYQEKFPNPGNEIIDHTEEIDLEYSLEDLPKVIKSMNIACDRLKSISTSLRTFSRADRDYKVPFNIHEGIDSTILILKHRLKANEHRPAIEVITEYGTLPQIECFPGQLNQVFMNIIANAIDALDESNSGRSFAEVKTNHNRITITTLVEDKTVKIAIADNGQGMNEEVKQKIFDHLFTTKAVGKGTGLGLAIARQIVVEKHNGTIAVNSVLGEGTEFAIFLPMKG